MKGCTVERARNGCHINTNYARLLLESLCHTHLIILLVFYIRRGVRCWQADWSVQKVLEIENVEFLNTDNILTIVMIVLPGSAPEYTWVEFALLWLFKTSFSVVLSIPTRPKFLLFFKYCSFSNVNRNNKFRETSLRSDHLSILARTV